MSNIEESTSPVRPIRCPRCGYDQRGIVATWKDSCPLEGTCSECGLIINWSEVLQPEKYEPLWCVEFARGRARLPNAALRTYLRSFRPWRFWSQLKMASLIRWRRLTTYLLLLLLPLAAGYVLLQTTAAVCTRLEWEQVMADEQQSATRWVTIVQQKIDAGEPFYTTPADMQPLRQRMQAMQQLALNGATIRHSYAAAIFEAVFLPLRRTSKGVITNPAAVIPYSYTPPADLHQHLDSDRVESAKRWGAIVLWPLIMLPLCFVLLPISRRRAKVRWSHIWRVGAYGLFLPVTAGTIMILTFALEHVAKGVVELMAPLIDLLGWITLIGLVIWWAVAIGRYLRMPHSWAVSIILSAMSLLLLMAWAFLGGFLF
ncbi:MAG: hypothetical protein JSV91_06920 [Phycisphaerales bacterium]|nr:MAG: hypothetical protein JSV91_06920 [Phycisphaerales bacterium]